MKLVVLIFKKRANIILQWVMVKENFHHYFTIYCPRILRRFLLCTMPLICQSKRVNSSYTCVENVVSVIVLCLQKGFFVWDGITDEKIRAEVGAYIIWFQYFDLRGNVHAEKKIAVLAGKMN